MSEVDPNEAPAGYYAVAKSEGRPKDGSNICRACDWREACGNPSTDLLAYGHRCVSGGVVALRDGEIYARRDGSSVIFRRKPPELKQAVLDLSEAPVQGA